MPKRLLLYSSLAVGLLVALFLVWGTWNVLSTSKMAKYIARLEAQGHRISIRQFVEPVPDELNATVLLNEFGQGPRVLALDLRNGKKDLASQALKDPNGLSTEQKEIFASFVEDNAAHLDLLRQIADRPHFTFEEQDLSQPPHLWMMPWLSGFVMRLRDLFAAAAVLGVSDETAAEALDLWRLGRAASRHFSDHPPAYSCATFGLTLSRCALDVLRPIVQGRRVETQVLRSVMKEIDPSAWREQFVRTLDMERVRLLDSARAYIGQSASDTSMKHRVRWGAIRPLERDAIVKAQEQFLRADEIMKMEPWKALAELERANEENQDDTSWWEAKLNPGGVTGLAANQSSVYRHLVDAENRAQIARLALACKAFHNDHGAWPESLEELVPEYLESIPPNLFTGTAFIYERRDGGFVIVGTGLESAKIEAWSWEEPSPGADQP